jgi:hypothetical protein
MYALDGEMDSRRLVVRCRGIEVDGRASNPFYEENEKCAEPAFF